MKTTSTVDLNFPPQMHVTLTAEDGTREYEFEADLSHASAELLTTAGNTFLRIEGFPLNRTTTRTTHNDKRGA